MFRGGEDVLTRGKAEIRVGRCHVRYIRPPGIPQEFLKCCGELCRCWKECGCAGERRMVKERPGID